MPELRGRLLPSVVAATLLLSATPPWLADLRERAEADARAAASGHAELRVTADDLDTMRRKLDVGDIPYNLGIKNLRLHLAERIGAARSAEDRAAFLACTTTPDGLPEALLAVLAAEPDAARRSQLEHDAVAVLFRALPLSQYAYLAESRTIGELTRTPLPGLRSRHEEDLVAVLDGARHVLYETEAAYRSLLAEVLAVELPESHGVLQPGDLPRLAYGILPDLRADVLGAAQRGLIATFTPDEPTPIDVPWRVAAEPSWLVGHGCRVLPIDPPAAVRVEIPLAAGPGGLVDLLEATGTALTFAAGRPDTPFEARWLAAPGSREAYGYLLAAIGRDPDWAGGGLGVAAELRARYLRAAALLDLIATRELAAEVIVEAELTEPRANALAVFAALHGRALGTPLPLESSAIYVEELRRNAPARFTARALAARMAKALRTAYGEAYWTNATAARKVRDGMRQAGYEEPSAIRNRFRAQRDDARTLVEELLREAGR